MKITLEYSEDEREEAYKAIEVLGYVSALYELDQWLRSKVKYEDREEFQEVRDKLHECLDGLEIWG